MKYSKKIIGIFIFFLISCSNEDRIENFQSQNLEYSVNLEEVEQIATNRLFSTTDKSLKSKISLFVKKEIESIEEIKNELQEVVFYVINYKKGGFIILSADKRVPPILANSEINKFIYDTENMPLGLKEWMSQVKVQISKIKKSDLKQSKREKMAWEDIQIQEILGSKDSVDDCYEHIEYFDDGPLLSTSWRQGSTFNESLETKVCYGYVGHVLAGCVPIALAQIMKYNEFPTSYNWSLMPNTYGTTTTQDFILDIHEAINNVNSSYPQYECGITTVPSGILDDVLKLEFGYSSATYATFSENTVRNEIDNNRPVMLRGQDANATYAHMWVCDGVRQVMFYYEDCTGQTMYLLHMNWGFDSTTFNGWYSSSSWSPDGYDFNYTKKMIYNIIP